LKTVFKDNRYPNEIPTNSLISLVTGTARSLSVTNAARPRPSSIRHSLNARNRITEKINSQLNWNALRFTNEGLSLLEIATEIRAAIVLTKIFVICSHP
jgi:hypothetical protein